MVKLHVRLTPKAAADRIDGWGEDAQGRRYLKVRVRAAPIEGRANAAVMAYLAERLGVPKSRLTLVAGETARLKTIDIDGLDEARLDELA
ncbi:MAG: DUF167 domain-containing protein [Asticcacaulis sp.]